ncbi:hypothetical protein BD289DRAFT_6418 [Coniella lustricola]|uniref:Uncharacterized protein n=1 Tax=Coniella lustricola TaxID=2025994 RepID=A0A2T3ANV3_9PEZI|nr:hypothetical protein BD289DRAFT_6418 [Coniella lustricola]
MSDGTMLSTDTALSALSAPRSPCSLSAQQHSPLPTTTNCYYLNGYANKSTNNLIISRPPSRSRVSASRVPTLSSGANAGFPVAVTANNAHGHSHSNSNSSSSMSSVSGLHCHHYGYRSAAPSAANGGRGLACNNPNVLMLSESRPSVTRSFAAIDDAAAAAVAAVAGIATGPASTTTGSSVRSGSRSTSLTISSTLSSFVDVEGKRLFPL